jgi:LysM repeat protein
VILSGQTLVVAVAFLVLSAPFAVHAGLLSFIADLLKFPDAYASQSTEAGNSQTLPLLKAAVNIDPSPLRGGGDITIVGGMALLSESGPSGTLANIAEHPTTDEISIYVVREGDTLSEIGGMFGVSVNTIVWANDIEKGVIQPGQTLVILPISGIRHTVLKGETLASIAKKYHGDAEEIMQFNNLSSSASLAVGGIIIIPDGEIAAPAPARSTVAAAPRHSGGPLLSGYFIRPVPGPKTQGVHGYNGIDLGSPYGTPILAAAGGTVIVARDFGWNGGYGTYLVIAHPNGTQTLYAHNSQNIVSVGQAVVQGQVIGYVGGTGKTTGAHLHFEVRGAKNPF